MMRYDKDDGLGKIHTECNPVVHDVWIFAVVLFLDRIFDLELLRAGRMIPMNPVGNLNKRYLI